MVFITPVSSFSLISNSNAPRVLFVNPGWYLLQIIMAISINRFQEIQQLSNITLTTRNEIYYRCYSVYLTEKQLHILHSIPEIKITRRIETMYRSPKQLLAFNETGKCQVKAIPDWSPNINCQFKRKSDDLFITYCKCSDLLPDDRIFNASPYSGRNLLNRYNSGFLQSGSESGIFDNGSIVSPHPIFDIGIHGENQIISITDTGVNNQHPFFRDPNVDFKSNVTLTNHRKILKYYNFANDNDGLQGHGTHCAGIAAGESYENNTGLSLYSGMAPKSKLVVVDIGFTGRDLDGEFGILELYQSLEDDGAFVNSNSWGLDLTSDTRPDTVAYDYLAYKHQHLLFTFAAGNEGRGSPYYTINSPGDSKNVLSIGGITRTQLYSIEYTTKYIIEINGHRYPATYLSQGENPRNTIHGNPAKKLGNLTIMSYDSTIIGTNSIIFVNDFGNQQLFCDIWEQVNSIQPAAVILTNEIASCAKRGFQFPIFKIAQAASEIIEEMAQQIELSGKASIYEDYPINPKSNLQLGAYSSKGPSTLGFFKPDVVVNGDALSASSGQTEPTLSSLTSKSGTSMATPAATGLLALINQYFTDGYYPSGKKDSQKGFLPTSSFLRAALINSAKPFQSSSYGPNIKSGFGIPNISSILLEPLRIVKNMSITKNSKHKYVIRTTSKSQSLRITIAYLDLPLDDTSVLPMYADLDLIVISPSGVQYTGNQKLNGQTEVSNTIERVIINQSQIEIGEYVVLIMSSNFDDPSVPYISYSLIVNGPFNQLDFVNNKEIMEPIVNSPTCDFKCRNGGSCDSNGLCQCAGNYVGYDCSIQYNSYEPNEIYKIQIDPNNLHYAHFDIGYIVPKSNLTIRVKTTRGTKYEAVLLFISSQKISTPSSPEVLPILQKRTKEEETYDLGISENETEKPLSLYMILKTVCAYDTQVSIQVEAAIDTRTQTPTLQPTRTIQPTPSASQTATPQNSDDISIEKNDKESYGIIGIGFLVGFLVGIMVILVVLLIGFCIYTHNAMREQREKDEFYSRKEEPKLEIDEKETLNEGETETTLQV